MPTRWARHSELSSMSGKLSITFFKFLPLHAHRNGKIVGKNCQNTQQHNNQCCGSALFCLILSDPDLTFHFEFFDADPDLDFLHMLENQKNFDIHSQQCQLY